jgi:hypothetical protein
MHLLTSFRCCRTTGVPPSREPAWSLGIVMTIADDVTQDTVAKRLMSNRSKFAFSELNSIVFRSAATSPIHLKFISLFPGLGYAAGYKIAQRVYKFGGQPYFRDFIDKTSGVWFRDTFGKKNGGILMHAAAGSMTGIGEVVSGVKI